MEQNIIQQLKTYNPVSIFLYGSRGRGDHNNDSDYEITVLFSDDLYISREKLLLELQLTNVSVYPYRRSEFTVEKLSTPFQKNIFLRELSLSARTIYGEKIVEALIPPAINTLDLMQRIRFDIGCAHAALISFRNNDIKTATESFSKSCLFGARCLVILLDKKFPTSYNDICLATSSLVQDSFQSTLDIALECRTSVESLSLKTLFDTIELLLYVEKQIIDDFSTNGIVDHC